MLGIIPRTIRDLLKTADELNGGAMLDTVKVKIFGRFGFLGRNQVELSQHCHYARITTAESFINRLLDLIQSDPFAKNKVMQIQLRVEKTISVDHVDVNCLSIFRFPSLQSYK